MDAAGTPRPDRARRGARRRRHNAGRWQIERERHQLPANCAPDSVEDVVTIGALAADLLKGSGLEAKFWEQTLIEEWHALVGDAVARRARPGQIQRKVLTIYVSNAAWMNELVRYGKTELLRNLRTRFGADRIADLRFAPDPDLQPDPRRAAATPFRKPGP